MSNLESEVDPDSFEENVSDDRNLVRALREAHSSFYNLLRGSKMNREDYPANLGVVGTSENIRLGVVFDRHVNPTYRAEYIEKMYDIIRDNNYRIEQGVIGTNGGVLRLVKRN